MTEIKKIKNVWQTIVIVLFAFLSVYFVVSIRNNNNSYKKEISALKSVKNSLEQQLSNSIDKDSILFYLAEQEILNVTIKELDLQLKKLKKQYNEKTNIDFHSLTIDSNIVILSEHLSK